MGLDSVTLKRLNSNRRIAVNEREPIITVVPHFGGSVTIRADEEIGDVRIADKAEAHPPLPGGDGLDIPEALFEADPGLPTLLEDRPGLPIQLVVIGRRIDLQGKADLFSGARDAGRAVEIHLYEHPDDVVSG